MAIALDYTARIDPAALKAAGASDVLRYLKPDSVPTYAITLTEYRELVAAGIGVTLNWEYDARDWLGGAMRGADHARQAAAKARALDYPAGCTIFGSADFDMTRTQWTGAGRAYAQAFATGLQVYGYRPGVYGPADVLTWCRDEGIMDRFWQAGMSTAWSGGRNATTWSGAHLRQRGHKLVGGQDTDWNEILIPRWGQTGADSMLKDEKIPDTGTPGMGDRDGATILRDIWRAVMLGNTSGGPLWGSSPFVELDAKVAALQAGPVSQDAVNTAVRAALADPAVVAGLAGVIVDEVARRISDRAPAA
jgi:hypothetical protein